MTIMLVALLMQAAEPAPMEVVERTDPLSDEVVIMAAATAGKNALAVGCEKNSGRVKVLFYSDAYLTTTSFLYPTRKLTYRFDQDKPVELDWWYSEHRAYIGSRGNVAPFARRMLTASKVFIRAQNYDGQDVDATFYIERAEEALRAVLRQCGDQKLSDRVFEAAGSK